MQLILDESALAATGTAIMAHAAQATAQTSAVLSPATAIVPAGLDIVSPFAAAGFAQYAVETTTNDAAMYVQAGLYGSTLVEDAVIYGAADAAGAAGIV